MIFVCRPGRRMEASETELGKELRSLPGLTIGPSFAVFPRGP
jgi:hypothetical protein